METKTIITIGRQYGSAGRQIGRALAEELGIKCYDKELLDRAAKDSGLCQKIMMKNQRIVFFILWLWIRIPLVIHPLLFLICLLIRRFFWHSLKPLRKSLRKVPAL